MKTHSYMTVKDTPISRAFIQVHVLLTDTIKGTIDTSQIDQHLSKDRSDGNIFSRLLFLTSHYLEEYH